MGFPGKRRWGGRGHWNILINSRQCRRFLGTAWREVGTIAPPSCFADGPRFLSPAKSADDTFSRGVAMDRRKNRADGAKPDAHDWSFPMAKRATNDDREPKGPTSKRQILKVVGGTPTPKRMSM